MSLIILKTKTSVYLSFLIVFCSMTFTLSAADHKHDYQSTDCSFLSSRTCSFKINTCTDPDKYAHNCDYDNDGILNIDDLDDDNDGILDEEECNSGTQLVSFPPAPTQTNTGPGVIASSTNVGNVVNIGIYFSKVITYTLKNDNEINLDEDEDLSMTYSFDRPIESPELTLISINHMQVIGNFSVEFNDGTTMTNIPFTIKDTLNGFTTNSSTVANVKDTIIGGISYVKGTPVQNSATLFFPTLKNLYGNGIVAFSFENIAIVLPNDNVFDIGLRAHVYCDNDNDGIQNTFDLDSDNDGCYDSYEAGVLGSTFDGSPTDSLTDITAGVGINGFANPLENIDADTASYINTYTYSNAVDQSFIACGSSFPVELISFSSSMKNCITSLDWNTAAEVDLSHFEIQRSLNGIEFESIDKVMAKGGTGTNHYRTETTVSSNSDYNFRLKMVDLDGTVEYSDIIYLESNCMSDPNRLYPNPVLAEEGRLTLEFNSAFEEDVIRIYNNIGVLVLQKNIEIMPDVISKHRIDVSYLPSGRYTIEVVKFGYAGKFIVL